jgi:hypothetical protein
MNKTTLLLSLSMMLSVAVSAQTKPLKTSNTKPLPDCVIIKDGKLQAKAGYTVEVSSDGKIFTVSNAKGNVSGTFTCACGGVSSGDCNASVTTYGIACSGNCNCGFVVVIKGVAYTIDLSAGVLRKN